VPDGYTSLMNSGGTTSMHKMHEREGDAGATALLTAPPRVINIGLELFAENLARQGAQVVHVRWSPPAGGNSQLASLLAKLRS
jgi:hypothetical protein